MKIQKPSLNEEILLWEKGIDHIIGIDEVGRGAFAGPVVAAAVVFPKTILKNTDTLFSEITDSKLLTPDKRVELAQYIITRCLFSIVATTSVPIINRIGIAKAAHCAFRSVLFQTRYHLKTDNFFVLADGFSIPYVRNIGKRRQKAIIRGDRTSVSIAAASILAKVHRDNLMVELHKKYKKYNFFANKGYGTKEHCASIYKYGLTKIHRTSFNLTKFLPVTCM